jgi:hypothetical protein
VKIWKSILILLITIFVGGGVLWIYQQYFSERKLDSLELINQEAVFIFETYQADETWNELVQQPIWNLLTELPAFKKFSTELVILDSLSGGNGALSKVIRNKQFTLSYHVTGADSFDLLFALNFGNSDPEPFLQKITSSVPKGSRFQTRKYSDHDVIEYYNSSNSRIWSFAQLENILVVSASSFLVEEAIRFYVSEDPNSFLKILNSTERKKAGLGTLLLSTKGLANLINGVSLTRDNPTAAGLASLNGAVALNLDFEENQLAFRGPAFFEQEVNYTPSVRANWLKIKEAVSSRTQSITQVNLGSIYESQKLVNPSFQPKSTVSGEIQTNLIERGFLDQFTGELYLLNLENSGNEDQNLVLVARTERPEQAWAFLKEFRSNSDQNQGDFYRGNEILYFPEEDFPAHLFNGKFPGFPSTYIAEIGELLILSNSQQGMKVILDDMANDYTWGSLGTNESFQKAINPSAGFSRTYFPKMAWPDWIKNSNPSWSTFLQKYGQIFRAFPFLSLRVHQISDRTEITLTLAYESGIGPKKAEKEAVRLIPNQTVNFDSPLIFGPYPEENFQDKTVDLLVQNEKNELILINGLGERVYSIPVSGRVISEPFHIDYFKNGKLQILIATEEKIYGIDRLGNLLPGYPLDLGAEKITHLNLVDYDNTKDYRYFVSTDSGNLYLLDKNGKALEGWDPKKTGEKSIAPPAHIRVPGKGDFMVSQTYTGKLNFFNRRGELQPGSPLLLGKESFKPAIAMTNSKGGSMRILAISSEGELVQANFSGEILDRHQIVKPDRDSEFHLVTDQNGSEALLITQQFNKVNVMNEQEKELFSVPVSGSDLIFQYFNFGAQRRIFALTDLTQEFCYLYDLNGNLLTATPLESTGKIQMRHTPAKGQYVIYSISNSKLFEYLLAD